MIIRRGLTSVSAYLILVLLGLFFLVPLLWPILASFNPSASLSVIIPAHYSLINYQTILTNGLVVLYTLVSRFFVRGVSGGLKG